MSKKMKKMIRTIKQWWYKHRYGIETDWLSPNGSMLPELGKGRFVSVLKKGAYIDIVAHDRPEISPKGSIRMIPYQPNHGFMVEFWQEGQMNWRTHLGYDALVKLGGPKPCDCGAENMKYTSGKPLLEDMIGRLAVCHRGIIGEIETAESSIGGVICRGHDFLTGDSWQARRPCVLDSEVEKKLRKALEWLKDQEAD